MFVDVEQFELEGWIFQEFRVQDSVRRFARRMVVDEATSPSSVFTVSL